MHGEGSKFRRMQRAKRGFTNDIRRLYHNIKRVSGACGGLNGVLRRAYEGLIYRTIIIIKRISGACGGLNGVLRMSYEGYTISENAVPAPAMG